MSDQDLPLLFFDERFDELPLNILERATSILITELPLELKEHLSSTIDEKGLIEWATDIHFTLGMEIRNTLREGGLYDNLLPTLNWDDYYIQCVEAALNKRTRDVI